MKKDFLYLTSVKSKKGDWFAVGHIINDNGSYDLKVTWIKSDEATCKDLKPLEVYEVELVDFNGSFATYTF